MAKLTTLQIFNSIMRNCGEEEVENMNNLGSLQSIAFDKLIEALMEICTEQNTKWNFLEDDGVIPMALNSYQYLISSLESGSDLQEDDRESFLAKDFGQRIKYITPQEFNKKYPSGVTEYGCPTEYTKYKGYFVFNKIASSNENAKNITFRYWKMPTLPATSSPNATLDIPEPFDRLLLIPLASMKVLAYLGNNEAAVHKLSVYGDGGNMEGSLAKLREIHSSPELKPRVTYAF